MEGKFLRWATAAAMLLLLAPVASAFSFTTLAFTAPVALATPNHCSPALYGPMNFSLRFECWAFTNDAAVPVQMRSVFYDLGAVMPGANAVFSLALPHAGTWALQVRSRRTPGTAYSCYSNTVVVNTDSTCIWGDYTDDGAVNVADLAVFSVDWASGGSAAVARSDFTGDGAVNAADLAQWVVARAKAPSFLGWLPWGAPNP